MVGAAQPGAALMSSALDRNLILGRIRDILGERTVATDVDHHAIIREYRQEPTLDGAARLELFVDRLVHYQVGVHRCEPSALRRTVAEALAARGKRELVAPAGLPENWMPAEVRLVQDESLSYEALDRSQG